MRRRGGPRLYYEVGGPVDAPPLLLIRGLARSSSYWLDFRDLLERERRVVVFDNRGVGRSETSALGFGTEDMADDAAAVLAASGVQRADVLGISLGGMIAQHLAIRHPHRVRRLVLGCTTPGSRTGRPIRREAALALARSAAMPVDQGIRFSAPWVLSPEHLRESPETVEVWVAIATSEPRSRLGVAGQLLAASRHDAAAHLGRVRARTLVVTGDRDRLIDAENSHRLAERLPNAEAVVLRGAAHDFPTERPVETARLVCAFT